MGGEIMGLARLIGLVWRLRLRLTPKAVIWIASVGPGGLT